MSPIKRKLKDIAYYSIKSIRIIWPKQVKRTVVVLGMHRSGTSLTAGILNILGIDLGTISRDTSIYNSKGHFENSRITRINKKILEEAGGDWAHIPKKADINRVFIKYQRKLLFNLRAEQSAVWALKDPRMILLMEQYLRILKNPVFIVCRRGHDSVARSLMRRNGFNFKFGYDLSVAYNKRIDDFLEKIEIYKYLNINFLDYFKNGLITVNRLSAFLNIKINKDQLSEIMRFISPDLVSSENESLK